MHQSDTSETCPEPEGRGDAPPPSPHSKNGKRGALRPTDGQDASRRPRSTSGVTAPDPAPETDWRAVTREIGERTIRLWGSRRDLLDDAVQDAALYMFVLARKERIEDPVALGVLFVNRRWIDELRRRRSGREKLDPGLDERPDQPTDKIGTVDWKAVLLQAGWEPTEAWSRILNSIVSGCRGTNKIAEALGKNVKTVHESRKRLQRWLEGKLRRPPAP